ncbi:prolyl 3-hydroxylase OGFOD1 isoform X2 [Rhipicephalus sanguineus]|uniref:prolyl 3-hydroxylase OGFOD1 isoform X2 n=1 Tax=Rhipicephalus sanguineus TaxID=34632 RepID=UPI0018938613|nr:prolyl 3-hydroxylase OGFOD1 isoform X2 [Rhipicephalus sanguineus]
MAPAKRADKGATSGSRSSPVSKRRKESVVLKVNSELTSDKTKDELRAAFAEKKAGHFGTAAELITDPFNVCVLHNLLEDEGSVDSLKNELFDIEFHAKNNDLYKFHQSDDLQNFDTPYIHAFRKCLEGTLAPWLRDVTGIPLDGSTSLTCSKYSYTDVLLCHDDECEGRRIAFILYLTPGWTAEDGGLLDLFDTDSNEQPRDIVRSILPRFNSLVFFEVSPVSFHQVAEVLSEDKVRLSVGGWFHGPPVSRPDPYIEPLLERLTWCHIEEELLRAWISPTYLADSVAEQVREQFKNESEIHLQEFLREDKCKALEEALSDPNVFWKQQGPRNRRWTLECPTPMAPVVEECLRVFRSEAMFLILSNLTGLKLHPLLSVTESDSSSEDDGGSDNSEQPNREPASCTQVVHKWSHGTYTLAHDQDRNSDECGLDVVLYLNCREWKPECGGFTTYIVKGEEEELLTLSPCPNSVALVYRDKGLLQFVKHINHEVTKLSKADQCFHDMKFVYYE